MAANRIYKKPVIRTRTIKVGNYFKNFSIFDASYDLLASCTCGSVNACCSGKTCISGQFCQ